MPSSTSNSQFLEVLGVKIRTPMLAVWHLRPILQRRFPLQHGRDRDWLRFLAWCATDGRRDYAILREDDSLTDLLTRPVELPALPDDAWRGLHSLATVCYAITLHRWSLSALLHSGSARNHANKLFWRGSRHRSSLPIAPWQTELLRQKFGNIRNMARAICSRQDRHLTDAQLVHFYALDDIEGRQVSDFSPVTEPVGINRGLQLSPLPAHRWICRAAEPILQAARGAPSEAERAKVMEIAAKKPLAQRKTGRDPFGVNLIGFSRGELGIGEDIRHVASALHAQGVPVCIVDFAPGEDVSQKDESARRFLSRDPRYAINIFCLTGIETVRFACEEGLSAFQDRYNIGLWPWELPDWPASCRHAYSFIDEVWGISRHTANAHRFAHPRPVLTTGLPVELGSIGSQTRADFGLPPNAYLYIFAFDAHSSLHRKNPAGVVRAFQRAFPSESAEEVGLVLKVSHAASGGPEWRKLRALAKKDKRIILVEQVVRRPDLLALMRCCDCYISLHRAEGFGRCLAEALLLGKQLVATNYSGNTDFCDPSRVAIVRHSMRDLAPGEYMWGDGQQWAEPDINHAADLMRLVREKPLPADHPEEGFEFSPDKVGGRYAARLRKVWDLIGPAGEKPLATASFTDSAA